MLVLFDEKQPTCVDVPDNVDQNESLQSIAVDTVNAVSKQFVSAQLLE